MSLKDNLSEKHLNYFQNKFCRIKNSIQISPNVLLMVFKYYEVTDKKHLQQYNYEMIQQNVKFSLT